METLRFEVNVPRVVSLAFAEGKPVESRFGGTQLMFSTVNGERFYVPPIVGDKIKAEGVTARQQIQLCKKQVGGVTQWEVKTHNAIAGQSLEAKPAIAPGQSVNLQPTATQEYHATRREYHGNAHVDHDIHADERGHRPIALLMMGALCAAVDAAMEAEIYGARQGRDFTLSEESIRALACTIFIQESRGGRA